MAKKTLLPFPELIDMGQQACCRCGYSLVGIPAPGECPECGLGFDDGVSALLIHGVMKKGGGPKWRRVVWIIIAVCAFLYSQLVFFIVFAYPLVALGGLLALVGATVVMALTNTQRSSGTNAIAFTRYGVSSWPIGSSKSDVEEMQQGRVFEPWGGVRRRAVLKKVSSVWATMKIRSVDERGKHSDDVQAGFRCRAEHLDVVQRVLDCLCEGESFDDVDGIELISSGDDANLQGDGIYHQGNKFVEIE